MARFSQAMMEKRIYSSYKVADKETGVRMPFGPLLKGNPPQLRIARKIVRLLKKGGPVKLMILKGRKLGMSTLMLLFLLEIAQQLPWVCGVITHSDKSCEVMYRALMTAWENCPAIDRQPIRAHLAGESIEFGERKLEDRRAGNIGNPGIIKVATAKGSYPFSSDTVHAMLMSEISGTSASAASPMWNKLFCTLGL